MTLTNATTAADRVRSDAYVRGTDTSRDASQLGRGSDRRQG